MNIAFDVHPLLDNNKSGVGYCQYGFIKTMIKRYPDNNYIFNFFNLRNYQKKIDKLNIFDDWNFIINDCKFCNNSIYKMIWNIIPLKYNWFFGKNADVTHFFNYHIPPGVKGKTVVTVHDMTYKRYPETVKLKTKKMLDINLKRSLDRADVIIAVSEFSKKEILHYFPNCEDKIKVIYNGVDLNRFNTNIDKNSQILVQNKYKIEENYLLYLGTIEPRKNIERLIESYYLVNKESSDTPKIVLAGGKGWMYDNIFKKVDDLKLKDKVIFIGYIEDEDVPALIKGAMIFLFPSIYEGFGMPPLEAMACGTPVLTSNISSLPEVVGDSGVLVDPFSKESIKDGILRMLNDDNLRQELSIKGQERAKLFSWTRVTEKLYNIYQSLMR